jgi:hypothetical protein
MIWEPANDNARDVGLALVSALGLTLAWLTTRVVLGIDDADAFEAAVGGMLETEPQVVA